MGSPQQSGMASICPTSEGYPIAERYHYAEENVLQYLTVWLPRPLPQEDTTAGYWIIYIHGGSWRDPTIDASSFDLTKDMLVTRYGSDILRQIDAVASVNYRLTAHPDFRQNLDKIEPNRRRVAVHPDHLNDVCTAINFLQSRFRFGSRYMLVGHSCGATLAFQSVMGKVIHDGRRTNAPSIGLTVQPTAIVGVEGIYDLRFLRDSFEIHTIYQEFIEDTFGPSEDLWDKVSPARATGDDGVEGGWKNGLLAVVAHSAGDELVDDLQMKAMVLALHTWKTLHPRRKVVCIPDLQKKHDEVWRGGTELATVIAMTIDQLNAMESPSSIASVTDDVC